MARYPAVPKFITSEEEAKQFYEYVQQWGAALINELDTRDLQLEAKPTSNIFAVVTVTEVGNIEKGNIVYAASVGKFKGYVSTTATQAWENLN